jgi:MerR family transcriptional regulator, mercuric resistance operon regulatory protein
MGGGLTIGRVAKLAGVNVETIRYYQRRGLVAEPDKPHMGYRRYPPDAVNHIRFIKRAQALGFTLKEVGILLSLDETRACGKTRSLAVRKMGVIEEKLAGLSAMRKALANLVRQCDAGRFAKGCPIIQALTLESTF